MAICSQPLGKICMVLVTNAIQLQLPKYYMQLPKYYMQLCSYSYLCTYTSSYITYASYGDDGGHYVYKVYESVLHFSGWQLLLPSVVDFTFAMTTPLSFVECVEVSGIAIDFMSVVLIRSMTISINMVKLPTTGYIAIV